jgi:hypothetical protein
VGATVSLTRGRSSGCSRTREFTVMSLPAPAIENWVKPCCQLVFGPGMASVTC